MKWTLVVVAVLGLIACNNGLAQANESSKDIPIFVKSFMNLQRGPPVTPSKTRAIITTNWIEQKLDHFDEAETRTWQMRYMENDEHFIDGGPIFIYLGGEWAIEPSRISGGHVYDMAVEHNAMLYYTEHRYYGESKPTSDITVDNLKYLHIKQALADVAHFIRTKRASEPALANSKVILVGGSYSATMVVWFKRLYPELMTGGWASSAPILAKVDFREYKEVVGRAMRELGSQQCYDRIQNGIAVFEQMFADKRGAEVKAMLKLCNNFDENNDLDLWSLFSSISNIFSGIVQYQDEGEVPYYCDYLMSFDDDALAIANFVIWSFGSFGCNDVTYKSTLNFYMDSTYIYGASRPWYFQTCNEYGWYQTSSSSNQPFGTNFPSLLNTVMCYDIFGSHYTNENINAKVDQTNNDFGGMNPEVDNVYMTHGALDPWNPMGHGVTDGATVIPRASHCQDLNSIKQSDSPAMRSAKERISELVREWLADDANDDNAAVSSKSDKARQFIKQLKH